ncbi:MAG: universal stress protein [Sulfitobacter sp.]|jgi:nucleotide-binding universal stress UspA family protein
MTKSVLCAVDISNPESEGAVLKVALQIAEMEKAQLDVITVVPDYGMSHVGGYFDKDHSKKMAQEAKSLLNDLISESLGAANNKNVRHIVATGSVYDEVLKTAKIAESDIIVVGAHKPDLKDFLLGPNAARIVRHAMCSVYVVR